MKKNASCKSIRTNITSNTNAFKPALKKPLQLDIPSYKNQPSPSTSCTTQNTKCPCLQSLHLKMHSEKKYFRTLKISETTKI